MSKKFDEAVTNAQANLDALSCQDCVRLKKQLTEAREVIQTLLFRGPTGPEHDFTSCLQPSCALARAYLEKHSS